MAATFESFVEDIERSYTELQERMSDPSVYDDHREAADVGRRLKELEGPHRLAQEWKLAQDDLVAAREDPDLLEPGREPEPRTARTEEDLRRATVQTEPADRK